MYELNINNVAHTLAVLSPTPLVLFCLSFSPSLSYCFHLSYLTLKDITTSM